MAIQDNGTRNQYTATASQTVFPYTFEVFDKDDLAVEQNGTLLTEGTHYTVSGVGVDAGGNMTLVTGATSGDVMTIYRDMDLNRLTDYQQNGDFLADEVNDDLDRVWAALQQNLNTSTVAIRAAINDSVLNSTNTEIASVPTRAGKALGFDSSGLISYLSGSLPVGTFREYSTIAGAQSDSAIQINDVLLIKDRDSSFWDVTAATTNNNQDIVDGTASITSFQLRITSTTSITALGVDLTGATAIDSASDRFLLQMDALGFDARYPSGTYKFDATFSVSAYPDLRVFGEGIDKTIFQLDMATTAGVQLGVGCTLEGISTTSVAYPSSAITDTTDYGLPSRRLDISNECIIRDVKWTNASGGLNAGSSVVKAHIENYSFDLIRERNGQGAGYHLTGATNVRAYNINGDHSDRGCEIEDGAVSCSVSGGKMRRIYPDGYVGQPGGYATSSFTLNAHAHEGTDGVKNIVYRDIEVEDCLLSIDCQRSTGTNSADMPQNCVWENIRVLSPRTTGAVPNPLYIEGVNCRLTNIVFEGTAIDSTYGPLVKVFGTASRGCVLENFEVGQKYNGTAVVVEADHTTLRNMSFEDQTGTPTVEDIVDISGEHVIADDLNFITPESARTFVRFRNGADHGKAHNCSAQHPGSNDVTIAAIQVESDHTVVTTNDFTSTLASVAVKLTANAAFDGGLLCQILNNNIDYGAANDVIELDTNTNRNLITGNITGANTQVIVDNGTDNTVINNKRGNVFS